MNQLLGKELTDLLYVSLEKRKKKKSYDLIYDTEPTCFTFNNCCAYQKQLLPNTGTHFSTLGGTALVFKYSD